ncbi:cyclic lactone autoinducer peptide [Terrisporobacter sp.]|nr:cyclic lactone autoinducer peptide [Terrisporobacter sp.]
MGFLVEFFNNLAHGASTYCMAFFFEPEVPKSLREE